MAYAGMLNISVPYLNECVKVITGSSVSHYIRNRIVLEAKRLIYHSDKSIKEIASELDGIKDFASPSEESIEKLVKQFNQNEL